MEKQIEVDVEKKDKERVGLYVSAEARRRLKMLAASKDATLDEALRYLLDQHMEAEVTA